MRDRNKSFDIRVSLLYTHIYWSGVEVIVLAKILTASSGIFPKESYFAAN